MTTSINNFLSTPIDGLIKYLSTDSDNDPVFNELTTLPSNKKSKNTPSKNLKRKTVDCLNQPIVKKTHTKISLENNLKTYPEKEKEELIEPINQTHERVKAYCLEEIQMDFANQFNIDIQEIKKIYLDVFTHSPTANEPSIINTKIPLVTNGLELDPAVKRTLVDSMNQLFDITNKSLEEIQMDFANQFNVDIQEIKKIYLDVSTHSPTADEPSIINTTLLAGNKLEVNPMFKKMLVDSVNRLFHITNKSLEEIQMDFANQFNVDIQEIKKIYLDVSTHSPTANQPSIIDAKASSVKNNIIISPELKKKIAYDINQIFDRRTRSLTRLTQQINL